MTLLEPDRDVIEHHEAAFLSPEAEGLEETQARRGGVGSVVDALRGYKDLRATPYGLRPVLAVTTLTFFAAFQGGVYNAASVEIRRDLNISLPQLIALLSTLGTLTAIFNIGVGYYADRKNRVRMGGMGLALSGVGGFATALSPGKATFSSSIGVSLVAGEVAGVPLGSTLADYYPVDSRGKAFALFSSLPRLTTVAVPAVCGIVVTAFSWRTPYFIFSVPLVVGGVLYALRMPNPIRGYFERKALGASEDDARIEEPPVSIGEGWRTIWAIKTLRRNFVADAVESGGGYVFDIFYPFYIAERFGLDAAHRGYLASFAGVFAVAGSLYGGGLVDRLLRRRPSQILQIRGLLGIASALSLFVVIYAPSIWLILVVACVRSLLNGLIAPASRVITVNLFPSHVRSTGEVLSGLVALPGQLIFLPIAGSLVAVQGLRGAMAFAIPLIIAGSVIALTASQFVEGDIRQSLTTALAGARFKEARDAGDDTILIARDVDVFYDQVQVLFGVDFDVRKGEIIALLGTNGAGKSTLLRAMSGTQEADGGTILYDGRDITHMPPHEVARRGVIHMPGGRGVFPGLSVRENLMLGTWMAEDGIDAQERIDEALSIFPRLRQRLDALAGSLSGGEQQQLSLAQAFMGKPTLLAIDELSLGLSPAIVGELLEIVKEINRRGVTIVVVEQSVNVALTIATRCVFMEKGEIRFSGKTADLLARSDIMRAIYVKGTGALTAAPASAKRSEAQQRALQLGDARPILEVAGLVKRYGGITAVDGVSFTVRDGEAVGMIGPNGSGKTTILEMISGYQLPDEGTVTYEGVDITKMAPELRAQRKLVRRFQDARLFPALTVYETLQVALEQQIEVKNPLLLATGLGPARRSERRLRARADRLIEILELGSYRDKLVRELSTGLRRIVDIACVLAAEPRLLLLDEPSSGIAQAETEGLGPLFNRIRFETGCALLIIEHDMPLISIVADELIAFEQGRLVVRGTPDEVLNDPRVVSAYLGSTEAAVNRSGVIS